MMMEAAKHPREKKPKKPVIGREPIPEEVKRKHEQVLRQILDTFDLEETMNKYRNSTAFDYRPSGKSLDDFRIRSELIRLMGTEVIRLNDKTWNQRFVLKQRENYQRLADQQEDNLAEAERKRLHRLRMDGIISDDADDLQADATISPFLKRSSTVERLEKGDGRPYFKDEKFDQREREVFSRLLQKTYAPPRELPSFDGLIKEPEEKPPTLAESVHIIRAESKHLIQPWRIIAKESTEPKASERALEILERRKRRYRHLPYEVAQLYEEETVAGLYKMAQRLINPQPPKSTYRVSYDDST